MKKKYSSFLILLFIILIFGITSESNGSEGTNNIREIRVGLKELYENVGKITVYNNSLIMGYYDKNDWYPELNFVSTNGFVFKPATNFYLISNQYFTTYDAAYDIVSNLCSQGYKAYVGSASKGIWKIYVGNVSISSEIDNIYNEINNINDITYEKITDNGERIIMEYSSGAILFENTYEKITFSTNDLVNNTALLDFGQRRYRGKIEIGRYNDKGITAINVIDLERYLYGVIPSEMIPSWPIEALKAQAVAARNYALYYIDIVSKYPKEEYDLCDTTNSQVYKGYNIEHANTTMAVNETIGKVVYYNNSIIPTYFFSTSGGHTENSENVWTGTVPYLKGVSDIYETEPARKPWLIKLSSDDIKNKLAKYDVDIGSITDVQVIDYSDSKRVMNLKIVGTNGEYIIQKETIRYWLGVYSRKFKVIKNTYNPNTEYHTISSNNQQKTINYNDAYVINYSGKAIPLKNDNEQLMIMSKDNIDNYPMVNANNDEYIFAGTGWGHGIGLSQSGAKGMAKAGYTYEEILKHYYTGTEIK